MTAIPELGPVTDREYLIHIGVIAPMNPKQKASTKLKAQKTTGLTLEQRANEIKHRLHQQGMTLKSWCLVNGFKYYTASNVLRGINKATFGEGREVAEKLGLKPDPIKTKA